MKTTLTTEYFNDFFDEYRRIKIINEEAHYSFYKRLVEVWEPKIGKPFYEFTRDEIMDIYSGLQSYNADTLYNYNTFLKNFANWLCDRVGMNIVPVYNNITQTDLKDCVDTTKRREQLLTKEQLHNYIDMMHNDTDKAILFLLFEGVGAGDMTELTFATPDCLDKKNCRIVFSDNKIINLSQQEYLMLRRGFVENELRAFGNDIRFVSVIPYGLYKRRNNVRYNSDDITNKNDQNRRYRFFTRRLSLMSTYLNAPLNCSLLWDSGLVYYFKQAMEESGLSFEEFLHTSEARRIGQKYNITSNWYVQILREKLNKYFK